MNVPYLTPGAGANARGRADDVRDASPAAACQLLGPELYWDTYWWSRSPDGDTGLTGPEAPAGAATFYSTLLDVHDFWRDQNHERLRSTVREAWDSLSALRDHL